MNKKILLVVIVFFSIEAVIAATSVTSTDCWCVPSPSPPLVPCGIGFTHISSVTDNCGGCETGWSSWDTWDCAWGYSDRETRYGCYSVYPLCYQWTDDWYHSSWRDGGPCYEVGPGIEGLCADNRHDHCCRSCWHWSGNTYHYHCSTSKCGSRDCHFEHQVWKLDRDIHGCGGCDDAYDDRIWQVRCKYYRSWIPPSGTYTCNCESGFQDCNNNLVDGCEIHTREDPNNCGGCGVTCSSSEWCYFGSCLPKNNHKRYFEGRCIAGYEQCDSAVAAFVTQHGSIDNSNACDSCAAPLYIGCVQPKCWCWGAWGNCDSEGEVFGNGCEAPIKKDNNNCGSSCTDCGETACKDGVCQNPDLWASCKFSCSCGIVGDDYVKAGGENTLAEEYCSQDDYSCRVSQGINSANYDYYNVDQTRVTEGCWADEDTSRCFFDAEDAWCRCDSTHLDCGSGSGCETDIDDPRHCGSCDHDCADIGCTGSEFLGIDKSDSDFFDVCSFACSAGDCTGYTLNAGFCNNDADCEYRDDLKCWEDVRQEDLMENWCCEEDECGHNGACYKKNAQINLGANARSLYVCIDLDDKMQWVAFGLKINLGRMIQYRSLKNAGLTGEDLDSQVAAMVNNTYYSHAGLTTSCSQSNYRECNEGMPHYAWQYCTGISAAFDGMFNLETGNNVPVLVSEQKLYDPYAPAKAIVKLRDCGLENRNEFRLKC